MLSNDPDKRAKQLEGLARAREAKKAMNNTNKSPQVTGIILAQRRLVRELLLEGKYFDSILRHPDINKADMPIIMAEEFLKVLAKDDHNLPREWEAYFKAKLSKELAKAH